MTHVVRYCYMLTVYLVLAGGPRDRAFNPRRFPPAERLHGLRLHVSALQVAGHAQGTFFLRFTLCMHTVPFAREYGVRPHVLHP